MYAVEMVARVNFVSPGPIGAVVQVGDRVTVDPDEWAEEIAAGFLTEPQDDE